MARGEFPFAQGDGSQIEHAWALNRGSHPSRWTLDLASGASPGMPCLFPQDSEAKTISQPFADNDGILR
jgi:hypothetical protein